MTNLLQDLRYAVRLLLRTPGFTLLAALTLALGIGANAAIFSVINAVLLAPLPYGSPERLTIVYSQFPTMELQPLLDLGPGVPGAAAEVAELRGAGGLHGRRGQHHGRRRARAGAGRPGLGRPLPRAGRASRQLGRTFTAKEDLPNTEPMLVLSHELWQRAFGADRGVLGRRVQVDGVDRTVIGVMPAGFDVGGGAGRGLGPPGPRSREPGRPGQPLPLHGGQAQAGRERGAGAVGARRAGAALEGRAARHPRPEPGAVTRW